MLRLDMVCMGNRAAAPPRRVTKTHVASALAGHNGWPFGPTPIKSLIKHEHGLHREHVLHGCAASQGYHNSNHVCANSAPSGQIRWPFGPTSSESLAE